MGIVRETVGLFVTSAFTTSLFAVPLALLMFEPTHTTQDALIERHAQVATVEMSFAGFGMDAEEATVDTPTEVAKKAAPAEPSPEAPSEANHTPIPTGGDTPTVAKRTRAAGPVHSVGGARRPGAATVAEAASTGGKGRCKAPIDGINKVNDTHYTVNRELVDHYATNMKALNSLGWVEKERGMGYEVNGFGCKGVLFKGGLRRGDVVLAVNDRPVKSIFQAIRAYRQLRTQDQIKVKVRRKGENVTLHYNLV